MGVWFIYVQILNHLGSVELRPAPAVGHRSARLRLWTGGRGGRGGCGRSPVKNVVVPFQWQQLAATSGKLSEVVKGDLPTIQSSPLFCGFESISHGRDQL